VASDPHDVVAELSGVRPGHKDILPAHPSRASQLRCHLFVQQTQVRDPGVIFQDELDAAKRHYREWVEAGFELHCLLDDDAIAEWLRTFPRRNLLPREVVSLVAAGFTPQELALRLWYGRLNPERLPLMDQLMRGTITAEQARTDLDKYGSAS
ncbi:hypothetical protein QRK81_24190, partial [Mycobacteroides abscessus]|nr:hypothetical protein [Mycobacteroides abscessus]